MIRTPPTRAPNPRKPRPEPEYGRFQDALQAEGHGAPTGSQSNPVTARVRNRVLFYSRRFSVYLVHSSRGHRIPPHVDMVARGRLFKLNLVLRKPQEGGEFACEKSLLNLWGRVYFFRPDLYVHEVGEIRRGDRWLLSFALNL